MDSSDRPVDILLTQKFLPEPGGSIRWMYEVYRRWPRPIEVITHDYYNDPPNTPEFPEVPAPPNGQDHVTDPNLILDRRPIFINDWGMENPRRVMRYARMTAAINERFRKHKRLRVHCTHAVPEVVSLIPLRWRYGNRLKIICYAHGEEVTACCSSRQLRFLMHRGNAIVDRMLANSRYTASVLADHINPDKVRVVNPGVEFSEFENAQEVGAQWRASHDLNDNLIVLTLGRLDPRKNHAAVVEAVARLAPKFPQLIYVLAGQGREMEQLKTQAAQLGIEDRIIFTGTVDTQTKLALYGACDVFAMPAIQDGTDVEGFGMVFLEAGACGKPTIAGSTGGQAEAVIDEKTGLIVDGTDHSAVTASLERLLSDKDLRLRLGNAGREHAQTFDWQHVVQRTIELVEEIK